MQRRSNRLFVLAVAIVVCALPPDDAAAQAAAVAPADPTTGVCQTQQFTATGIDIATAVEAGVSHTCSLVQDGTVRCWGQNDYGQLGDGTTTIAFTPLVTRPTPKNGGRR